MSRTQRLRAFACSPTFKAVPAISGTAKVGQVLTASDGVPVNGTVTAHQWARGGVAIAGATGATYSPVAADVDSTLTVTITLTNQLRPSNVKTATSLPSAAVVA